jgi:hypothetical protein
MSQALGSGVVKIGESTLTFAPGEMKSFDLIQSRREGLISKEPSDYQAN